MAKKSRTGKRAAGSETATADTPDLSHIPEPIRGLAVPIDSIRPAAKNPVDHDEQNIEGIMASLREFGQMVLLDVNAENGEIVKGNGTWEAARRLGWSHIAVLYVKLDPARQHAFAIADNRVAEFAQWNEDILSELSAYIATDAPEMLAGLEDALLLDELLADSPAPEPGEAPAPRIDEATKLERKWKTKPGQVWEIPSQTVGGESHRLWCGKAEDVLPTLGAGSIDMIFTDPPYGHNNQNGDLQSKLYSGAFQSHKRSQTAGQRPIANDGDEANQLVRFLFREAARLLKPGCCCCCCGGGGGGPDPQFARWSLWLDESVPFKMCVIWDKGGLGMGWHYRRCWECVLVAQKQGAACNWHGGKDVPNIIRDVGKIIPSADEHPTVKPVELAAWFIRLHSQSGETVLDGFSGSGTTLVACEQLGRLGYGIEIEPKYVAVTLERLAEMGLEPRLAEDPPAKPKRSRRKAG